MGQLLIEIDNHKEFRKGDMLIFNGKQFETIQKEHVLSAIPYLNARIDSLSTELELVKLAMRYDHGEISQEEYEELCNGLKK